MGLRQLFVFGHLCLWVASGAVVMSSEQVSGSPGLLQMAIAVGIAAGLWNGSPAAWWVALTLEIVVVGLLVSLLAWPWGAATALVILGMLRLVVLLQRPLRQIMRPRRASAPQEH
ncbi:hypothetical protein BH23ACT6_BH23ACT6_28250 [soil metagenome]